MSHGRSFARCACRIAICSRRRNEGAARHPAQLSSAVFHCLPLVVARRAEGKKNTFFSRTAPLGLMAYTHRRDGLFKRCVAPLALRCLRGGGAE